MQNPSKRVHQIKQAEAKRQQAISDNNTDLFAQAVAEIKALESEKDVYTCVSCAHEFEHGPHVDVLAAAILTYGEDGLVSETFDFGLHDVIKGETGRRLKFCNHCVKKWKHNIHEYVEMR